MGRGGREQFQVMVDRLLVIDDAKDVQDLISYCARRTWPQAEVDWYDPVAKGRPDADFDWSRYDFVFLDAHFGVPGEDGLEWLKEFSRDGKLPPVIVLIDRVSEESSAIARKLGAKYYIDKHDLSPRLLASAVEAIIDNRAWVATNGNEDLYDEDSSDMVEMEDLDGVIEAELPPLDLELYDDEGSEPIIEGELADVFGAGDDEPNLQEIGEPIQSLPFNIEIPGYQLLRLLSSSASSLVLLAEREKNSRLAVLKVISTDVQDDKKVLKRFMREQRMLSKLRHPNVVKIYAGGVTADSAYIAMEYFPGGISENASTRASPKAWRSNIFAVSPRGWEPPTRWVSCTGISSRPISCYARMTVWRLRISAFPNPSVPAPPSPWSALSWGHRFTSARSRSMVSPPPRAAIFTASE